MRGRDEREDVERGRGKDLRSDWTVFLESKSFVSLTEVRIRVESGPHIYKSITLYLLFQDSKNDGTSKKIGVDRS